MTMPGFADIIKATTDQWDDIPNPPLPYYLAAKEGIFLHRRLAFGRGLVKQVTIPATFAPLGVVTGGSFLFEADPIPAHLMGQIVSFFKRVYQRQQTEAAVLLTMNMTTKEWGIFVPTQMVSHGGVNYVYDPTHITGGRIVVGSIHSHADFSPFHSGTDTNDAAEFDGFHCTIGFVNSTPKIVAMVAMNKQNMHYGETEFPALFDWTEIDKHPAPDWWDQYVERQGAKDKPVGFDLYAKFAKPTIIKSHVSTNTSVLPALGFRPDHDRGRQLQSDWGIDSVDEWFGDYGRWSSYSRPTSESQEFNRKQTALYGYGSALLPETKNDDPYWEDGIDPKIVDLLLSSSLFTEEDLEFAIAHPTIAKDIAHWQRTFYEKAIEAVEILNIIGVTADLSIKDEPPPKVAQQFVARERRHRPRKTSRTRRQGYGVR